MYRVSSGKNLLSISLNLLMLTAAKSKLNLLVKLGESEIFKDEILIRTLPIILLKDNYAQVIVKSTIYADSNVLRNF